MYTFYFNTETGQYAQCYLPGYTKDRDEFREELKRVAGRFWDNYMPVRLEAEMFGKPTALPQYIDDGQMEVFHFDDQTLKDSVIYDTDNDMLGAPGFEYYAIYASAQSVKAGIGSGRRSEWYIGTYPDRKPFHTDGYQCAGFKSEEEAQAALDELYSDEYYRNRYPDLQVLHKMVYSVYHD